MTAPRFPRLLAVALFALYAAWAFVVPVYEAPDEPAHWQYARYLHDRWALPHYEKGFEEANSPPLAYLLFAPLAVDAGSPDMVVGWSPQGAFRLTAPPRTFLNTGEAFQRFWPLRLARLLAALISLGTVIFTWRAGIAARDASTGMVAALIAGLLPTFAFRAGHVSNDALLACAAAAATWGIVRLVREPFAWRVALGAATAVGVAYLSKISGIALVPPLALALVAAQPADGWRTRGLRLAALGLAGAIVLPWTLRNLWLYGDPFASEAMRQAVAHLIVDRPLLSRFFLAEFPRALAKSFVGIFGWATIMLPLWFYRAFWMVYAIGGLGVLAGLRRRTIDWRLATTLGLICACALAVVVRINLQFTQIQGRYLFPALPAFAVLMALGLRSIAPVVTRAASPINVGLLFGIANLYVLLGVIWPAYYPAPLRTLASGERLVMPTGLTDLHVVDADLGYAVGGPRPRWTSPVDVDAAAFDAVQVELTATATPATQRGCVRYASSYGGLDTNPPACFDWLADGRPHVIRVTLRGRDGWSGHLSHVSLEPFADGGVAPGLAVRTRGPRLIPAAAAPSGGRP